MDSDRLIRISLPGIGFLVAFLYFDWLVGGSLLSSMFNGKSEWHYEILAAFLSTPLTGFILSTFTHDVIRKKIGVRYEFKLMNSRYDKLRGKYFESLKSFYDK